MASETFAPDRQFVVEILRTKEAYLLESLIPNTQGGAYTELNYKRAAALHRCADRIENERDLGMFKKRLVEAVDQTHAALDDAPYATEAYMCHWGTFQGYEEALYLLSQMPELG